MDIFYNNRQFVHKNMERTFFVFPVLKAFSFLVRQFFSCLLQKQSLKLAKTITPNND